MQTAKQPEGLPEPDSFNLERMEFSIMTEPQMGGTYEELLAIARFAEDRGLVSFARSDHY